MVQIHASTPSDYAFVVSTQDNTASRKGAVWQDVDEKEDYVALRTSLQQDGALRLLCPRVAALLMNEDDRGGQENVDGVGDGSAEIQPWTGT